MTALPACVVIRLVMPVINYEFMRNFFLQILLLPLSMVINGQSNVENVTGQVSFVSSRNVYVKFRSTSGIIAGDTLYTQPAGQLLPVLIVNNLSSTSCVCTPLSERSFSVADLIIARIKREELKAVEIIKESSASRPSVSVTTSDSAGKQVIEKESIQRIKGNISLSSYSEMSNTISDNSQRFRYTLSFDARNIGNSKFSVENYISFKHKAGEWEEVKNDVFNALKIYNLAVRYDLNTTTQISLGRRINPRISGAGAIDGLQFEKRLNGFSFGALAGFRPDYTDYGFDSKLFQYGAWIAYNSGSSQTRSESSIAFMQQMNDRRTDRRFLYFQHSNTFVKNLNFFSTFEFDLYKLKIDSLNNEQSDSAFDLTGLYISLRYRFSKNFNLYGSYDARKNIMYCETYKTFTDRILETELRQGFRLQANYRITKSMLCGIRAGYRFLKTDPHPSRNLYTWLTFSQIPGVNLSGTVSAAYLETSHINGMVAGMNLDRDFLKGKIQTGIGYKFVDYMLPENLADIVQNIGEISFSWQFCKNISVSMYYEGTFERNDLFNRLYVQVRKRF